MKFRLFSIFVVGLFFLLAWQHQAISDWWFLRNYEPSEEISSLASDSYMSEHGERLFYLADPRINDKEEFNENCPIIEKSFVLGCYASGRIYILSVDQEALDGVMEVTAAHEMLHKAYDRLSESERAEIVDELEDFYATIENETLRDLIDRYEERGGVSVRQNELHSILPTQVVDMPPQLEEYYDRYFTDRESVARMYESYEAVFIEIQERIEELRGELSSLRSDISVMEQELVATSDLITNLNQELERREDEGDIEGYNELVPEQNQAVARYNSLLDRHRSAINTHNRLVDDLNDIVLYHTDLVNSLDSSFQSM